MTTPSIKILRNLVCIAMLCSALGVFSQSESRHMRVISSGGIVGDFPVCAVDSVKYPMLDTGSILTITMNGESSLAEAVGSYYLPAVEELTVIGAISADDLKYIAENLTSLRSLDLSAATTADGSVPDNALVSTMGLHALRNLVLPTTTTKIGTRAFPAILSLENMDLPQGTTEVGASAFSDCVSMSQMTIPAALTKIGDEAFSGCVSLGSVTSYAVIPPSLGENAFAGIRNQAKLIVPFGSGRDYAESAWGSYFTVYEEGYLDTPIPAEALCDDIFSFALGKYDDVKVDKKNKFITVKIPSGSFLKKLTPIFTLRNGVSATVDDVELVSGESTLNCSVPFKITLTDLAGQTTDYVVGICYSDMPMVYINTTDNAEIASREEYVGITDLYVMNSDFNGSYELARIKGRGNSSWSQPKKSYTMKLNKKAEFMGFKKHKTFAFVANYSDKTLMRNSFIYEMGRTIFDGMTWNPSTVSVHLVVNGEYYGVYQLCETNKIDANRVNIPNIEDCTSIEDAPNYGFLLEANRHWDEYFNFRTRRLSFSLKDPDGEDISEELREYIKQKTADTETSLYAQGYNDPTAPNWYANLFDRDSFVDWLILNELSKNNDSVFFSSCYTYYNPADGKFHMGPLWDYDISCGNINYNDCDNPEGWLITDVAWYRQMLTIPDFKDAFKARFYEVKDKMREYINVEMPRQAVAMEPDAKINFKRWPILGKYVWPNAVGFDDRVTYMSEVDYLIEWLNLRLQWMEEAIDNM